MKTKLLITIGVLAMLSACQGYNNRQSFDADTQARLERNISEVSARY